MALKIPSSALSIASINISLEMVGVNHLIPRTFLTGYSLNSFAVSESECRHCPVVLRNGCHLLCHPSLLVH
ncbi:hypothetical protein T06_5284 [Trichinella sp. T6]|nr:hypothetical protein T06_5284 [Trichinella sp. T6]